MGMLLPAVTVAADFAIKQHAPKVRLCLAPDTASHTVLVQGQHPSLLPSWGRPWLWRTFFMAPPASSHPAHSLHQIIFHMHVLITAQYGLS